MPAPKLWYELVDIITPSIVKIETPDGHGTGFFIGYNQEHTWALIATAGHVVENADHWLQPIRIHNIAKKKSVLLQESSRVMFPDPSVDGDTAIIFAQISKVSELDLPEKPIGFIESGMILKVGVDVAWLGYPGIAPNTLCFFSGNVSARRPRAYLIDGVSVPGVSGGPVFYCSVEGEPTLVGSISGYLSPERAVLGLCVAHDVSHLQKTLETIKNQQEAEEKKKEQEVAAAAAKLPTPAPGSPKAD